MTLRHGERDRVFLFISAMPAARTGDLQKYRVCYTASRRLRCRNRTIRGRTWDSWRFVTGPWSGRYVVVTWRVSGRIVARKRVWIYE